MRRPERRTSMRPGAALILAAGALILAGCGREVPEALPTNEEPVEVRVSRAVRASAPESFPATLTAETRARVATRTSGRVREVRVDVGSAVHAGEPLVLLDAGDVRARVEAAEAQLELTRRSFRRIESLAADGAASDQELDEARARRAAAEAAARDARAQLDYVVVRAPFDGRVASRSVEPGDLAIPGMPLLTIVGRDGLVVEADLPADRRGAVAEGDAVVVRVPGSGLVATGTVTRVAPVLEPGTRRLRVEALLESGVGGEGAAVPGAYARLELAGSGPATRWVPEDALVRRGQLTGVFALEGGVLRLRWLRPGTARAGAVEVLAGPPGELTVVRDPRPTFRDGHEAGAVEVVPWGLPTEAEPSGAPDADRAAVGTAGAPPGGTTSGDPRSGDAATGGTP